MTPKTQQNIFLFIFSLVFFALALPVVYGGTGIDSAWHEALVMAINKNEVFGRDFIFNYGPLGYFNTRLLPQNISPWLMVLLDVFILLNLLIINKLAFQKADKNWKIAALISLLILMPWGFIADCSFTLFYFLLFWLFYLQRTRNAVVLLIAVVISVLIFYVKVNLSMVAYGIFYVSLIYFWWSKIISFRTAIVTFFLQIALTFSLSFLLKVDILAYLQASLKIIDAYQDAMAEVILPRREFLALLTFEGLILIVVFTYILVNFKRFFHYQYLYFFGIIALAWFLSFKQAHTAVGPYNIFGCFLFTPPLAVLIYLFGEEKTQAVSRKSQVFSVEKLFIFVFVISISATQLLRFYMGGGESIKRYFLTYLPHKVAVNVEKEAKIKYFAEIFALKNPFNYFKEVINYDYENNFKSKERQLPEKILKEIGKSSVDILPTDIDFIFFNKLNYVHRPIIQSYQANSDWLAAKNGEKYNSKTAPEFVLFQVKSFREQNPFWEDGEVNLALLKNYHLIDTAFVKSIENRPDTLFILQKNAIEKALTTKKEAKKSYKFNEDIPINATQKLLYFDADIQYSFLGKMARFVFQPPYLYCTLTYENDQQQIFRIPNTILRGEILVNRKITTQKEAANFFLTPGKNNLKIKKIRFWAKYQWGFRQKFEGSFREIEIN